MHCLARMRPIVWYLVAGIAFCTLPVHSEKSSFIHTAVADAALLVPLRTTAVTFTTIQTRNQGSKQIKKKRRKSRTLPNRRSSRRRTARANVPIRSKPPGVIRGVQILYDSLLVPGIIYRKLDVLLADSMHSIVHAVTCVVRNPRYTIELAQACDQLGKLESVPAIVNRFDSTLNRDVLIAINASFWQAGTRLPIGVSINDGELITATAVPWNALWLDRRYRPWIDSAFVELTLRLPNGTTVPIASANQNLATDGVALFNRFAGDSIPQLVPLDTAWLQQLRSLQAADTLDPTISTDSIATLQRSEAERWLSQYRRGKMLIRYLRQPAINQPIPCVVLAMLDSGRVEVPLRGAVLSYPVNHLLRTAVRPGDTVTLFCRTKRHDSLQFHYAVSGTPTLVADGQIKPQLEDTTHRGSAFVEQRLARTAIGTDLIQSVLYFVAVEATPGVSVGMNLRELAQFMKRFGAYNALNLDGGGSTTMVVGGRCVVPSNSSFYRPVANALVIWQRRKGSR